MSCSVSYGKLRRRCKLKYDTFHIYNFSSCHLFSGLPGPVALLQIISIISHDVNCTSEWSRFSQQFIFNSKFFRWLWRWFSQNVSTKMDRHAFTWCTCSFTVGVQKTSNLHHIGFFKFAQAGEANLGSFWFSFIISIFSHYGITLGHLDTAHTVLSF